MYGMDLRVVQPKIFQLLGARNVFEAEGDWVGVEPKNSQPREIKNGGTGQAFQIVASQIDFHDVATDASNSVPITNVYIGIPVVGPVPAIAIEVIVELSKDGTIIRKTIAGQTSVVWHQCWIGTVAARERGVGRPSDDTGTSRRAQDCIAPVRLHCAVHPIFVVTVLIRHIGELIVRKIHEELLEVVKTCGDGTGQVIRFQVNFLNVKRPSQEVVGNLSPNLISMKEEEVQLG
mmetsp:Transcript_2280/g.5929  ORF Transcript_2280/g.5929 Transcript_2280/m.5929 type:complete len:233 (-) Transcript_2280:894-1592(-)